MSRVRAASLAAILLWTALLPAAAHEVIPATGDLRLAEGQVTLTLELNAEARVAGLNLDGVEDTSEVEGNGDYDSLRALPPARMQARIRAAWDSIGPGVILTADGGGAFPLTLTDITVPEVGSPDLPRRTRLVLTGDLPPAVGAVTLTWGAGNGTLILRHVGVEDGFAGYLDGGDTSPPLTPKGRGALGAGAAFAAYIPVGFTHIVPKGLDHILFVLGLFFLSPKLRPLLWQISAFTLAHTVTLALGALGWADAPARIVEPLIALSIAFVAVENILSTRLHRWRPVLVFAFGLLHGLGFASVLSEFGLPQAQLVPALLGFNIGVELGQLAVIAVAFLALAVWFRDRPWYRPRIAVPASAVIGLVGFYWFVERAFL